MINDNKRIRKSIKVILLAFAFSLVSVAALADDPGTPGGNDDPDAPIDGGLSVLIACGVGYGVKKLANKKKDADSSIRNDQ